MDGLQLVGVRTPHTHQHVHTSYSFIQVGKLVKRIYPIQSFYEKEKYP